VSIQGRRKKKQGKFHGDEGSLVYTRKGEDLLKREKGVWVRGGGGGGGAVDDQKPH